MAKNKVPGGFVMHRQGKTLVGKEIGVVGNRVITFEMIRFSFHAVPVLPQGGSIDSAMVAIA